MTYYLCACYKYIKRGHPHGASFPVHKPETDPFRPSLARVSDFPAENRCRASPHRHDTNFLAPRRTFATGSFTSTLRSTPSYPFARAYSLLTLSKSFPGSWVLHEPCRFVRNDSIRPMDFTAAKEKCSTTTG